MNKQEAKIIKDKLYDILVRFQRGKDVFAAMLDLDYLYKQIDTMVSDDEQS